AVVHLVDVIARAHEDDLRILAPDDVDVLVNRVRRALVPIPVGALLRRKDFDELVEARIEEAPAALQVADEAMRLVLRADVDAADAGVQAIGEREVDDAELPAESHGWLGAPIGELLQSAAATSREDHRDRAACREGGKPDRSRPAGDITSSAGDFFDGGHDECMTQRAKEDVCRRPLTRSTWQLQAMRSVRSSRLSPESSSRPPSARLSRRTPR